MTDLQLRLLELTDEIKEICKKEKLRYVVSDYNYAYLLKHKKYEDEQCYFNIMMPLEDALKLEKYVNKNSDGKRIIESWNNSPGLQMLKFRYVDLTSLLFDGSCAEKYLYKGIFVNILPTREFEPANDVRGIERYVQLINYDQEKLAREVVLYKLITRFTHLERFKEHAMRKIKLDNANYIHHGYIKRNKMTKEEMIKYVIDANLKAKKPYTTLRYLPEDQITEDTVGENCFAYMDERSRVVKFPKDLYTNISETEFEGRKFNLYNRSEDYFGSLFGTDWQIKLEEEMLGSDRSTFFYDVDIPYTEYLDYIKDDDVSLDDVTDNKLKYNYWMGQVHNPAIAKTWHTYMICKGSVERIDVWYSLRNKREELKEAYDNKDLAKLRKLMNRYLKASKRFTSEKVGFYIDDELFKYASYIWECDEVPGRFDEEGNKITYAQYVYSLVPDLYKNETPDEYFAKRNKTFDE